MIDLFSSRLDPALLRPGRVDLSQHIGYASEFQLRRIYHRFYPEESEKNARLFASLAMDTAPNISMAQVQGLFLLHKYDAQGVFRDLAMLSPTFVGAPSADSPAGNTTATSSTNLWWQWTLMMMPN